MTHNYKGKNIAPGITPRGLEEVLVHVETEPQHINFIMKIVESHCHTALPLQIAPDQGVLAFLTTHDKLDDLTNILSAIPRPLNVKYKITPPLTE